MAELDSSKACRKCGEIKPLALFNKNKTVKDGHERVCLACRRAAYAENREEIRAKDRIRHNSAAAKEVRRQYRQKPGPKAALKKAMADWYTRNKHYVAAKSWLDRLDNPELAERERLRGRKHGPVKVARRRARKKQALPVWADAAEIAAVYAGAKRMSAKFRRVFHVDHIVPLASELVCGLHCVANLQVLDKTLNLEKNNTWWPDMWPTPRSDQWQ